MVYVRVKTDNDGSQRSVLNLRDNGYKLISSFNLKREGNYFTAVLIAPQSVGYYSLETRIESGTATSTSVKTMKIGNPIGANVKVNIDSRVEGKQVSSKDNVNLDSASSTPAVERLENGDGNTYEIEDSQKSFVQNLTSIIREIVDFLWPF